MIRRHRPAEKGWGRRRCRLPAAHCSGKRQHFEGWPLWWGQRCGRQPSGKGWRLPPSASGGCERSERVVAAGWALLPLPEINSRTTTWVLAASATLGPRATQEPGRPGAQECVFTRPGCPECHPTLLSKTTGNHSHGQKKSNMPTIKRLVLEKARCLMDGRTPGLRAGPSQPLPCRRTLIGSPCRWRGRGLHTGPGSAAWAACVSGGARPRPHRHPGLKASACIGGRRSEGGVFSGHHSDP